MTSGWNADSILHQAPDAVIFADREGLIRFWNPGAERIFGHAAADVLGGSLYVIIPESFREAHDRGFARALAAGETKYAGQALPTKALHADGHEIYVELSFAIIKTADGTVVGASAHARDITERFTRDRDARRRMKSLEQELESLRGTPATPAGG